MLFLFPRSTLQSQPHDNLKLAFQYFARMGMGTIIDNVGRWSAQYFVDF